MDLFCEKKISYARRDWKTAVSDRQNALPGKKPLLNPDGVYSRLPGQWAAGAALVGYWSCRKTALYPAPQNGFSTCHPSFPMSITYWKAGSGPWSILRKGLTETGCSCRYDGIRSAGNNFLHTSWGRAVGRINDSATSSYAATCLRLRPCW